MAKERVDLNKGLDAGKCSTGVDTEIRIDDVHAQQKDDAIDTGATGIVADNSGAVSQGAGALSGATAKSVAGGVGESSGAKMDVIIDTNTSAEEG
ncbi:hypothetical protein RIF29_21451 [Crotalaria pallida]|uniref:Uncharacterized protein n=1 Tax=Crotalaria pallida TaxID=3830 RepID=A0AAN9FBJ4_CROPI